MEKKLESSNIESSIYPQWVKIPNPNFGKSFLVLLIIIGCTLLAKIFLFSILSITGIDNPEYVTNEYVAIFQIIFKIVAGIFGTFAVKPIKTPIWFFGLMVIGAFIPFVCNIVYFYFGKYLIMSKFSFTSPFKHHMKSIN